jgi:hypothetical protein
MKVYQTREFCRLARKQRIGDSSLKAAIERAESGLVDAQIGRFLIKQRVARPNEGRSGGYRAILFFRQRDYAAFLHLFAKNDKANLTGPELAAYREFAKQLSDLGADHIKRLVDEGKWIEIEYEDDEKEVP